MAEQLGLITAIISFVTAVIGLVLYIIKRQNSKAFYESISGRVEIQQHQDLLLKQKKDEIQRILLLSSQNGGGMPRIGSELSVSVILESCDTKKTDSLIEFWQKRVMDGEYYSLLSQMITSKLSPIMEDYHEFDTEELNRYGILRKSLESQEVGHCRMYYVGQRYKRFLGLDIRFIPQKLFFLGINYTNRTDPDPSFDAHVLDYIEMLKKKMNLK